MMKMVKLFAILSFLILNPIFGFSQHTLTIRIGGLRNSEGKVHLELSNERGESITSQSKEIDNNQSIIIFRDIKSGSYSFKFFHDQNNNGKLDTNLIGIPKEGFGFANNAMGKFGPPPFEKTIVQVKDDTSLQCNVQYF